MTNNTQLSHDDAYKNFKMLERYDRLEKSKVYGFGVRGKRFTLVKKDDSFISKIWFSILKFLRFVKADPNSVSRLREYTDLHCKQGSFQSWANENGKVSLERRSQLLLENAELTRRLNDEQLENQSSSSHLHHEIETKNSTIESLRSEIASERAEHEKISHDLRRKEEELINLKSSMQSEIDALRNKSKEPNTEMKSEIKNYESKIKKLEKENLYYSTGWKELSPDKRIRTFLKEHNLYEGIQSKFPSKKKSKKNKKVDVLNVNS
ncbi:MAG: hypothetical protein VX777_03950 [Chlamydiota bacterium]|nr:hypothetical protein [Chlamydiota bacterium]